jgi:hypothetical protein
MRNKIIPGLFAALLCLSSANLVQAAYEQGADTSISKSKQAPLMVIRFNQPVVLYQKALYDTMVQAFKVKPSAKFDVVSVARKGKNADQQKEFDDVAAQNTGKVIATFQEMGMPLTRYTLSTTTEPVKYSEVRIYVH